MLLGCAPAPQRVVPRCPASEKVQQRNDGFEARVDGARLSFVFHASRWSNLLYQLDCLARLMPCSTEAYAALWQKDLGGLDSEDRAALERWRQIRQRYQGRIEAGTDSEDPLLPLPLSANSVETHIRLAQRAAGGLERYRAYAALFMEPRDVEASAQVIERFAERHSRAYAAQRAPLEERAQALAERFRRAKLGAFIERAARFYDSELPPHTELEFELLFRPEHDSASYGQNRGRVSFVELVPQENLDARLAVVMHELFHFLFATAKRDQAVRLANVFANDDDPLAYPAWGLLDESLAAALGNGMVLEKLDAGELERRLGRPDGLYSDDLIDAVARELLTKMPVLLDTPGGLYADSTRESYLAAVRTAFPHGLPPRAYLRPWVCLYDPSFVDAYDALARAVHAPVTVSDSSVVPRRTNIILEQRARWSRVLMLRRADLQHLEGYEGAVGAETVRQVRQRAKQPGAFVVARASAPQAFVFVADTAPEMKRLVADFAKLSELRAGVVLGGT
ncbi:MAG: hypothetical protein KC776_01880 [Myxococcales bacterium]|nr:hypothetical protein [Myxococcales bacterium]MCB9579499.1 hypothetical protein [Polyangiaceae bacterium]